MLVSTYILDWNNTLGLWNPTRIYIRSWLLGNSLIHISRFLDFRDLSWRWLDNWRGFTTTAGFTTGGVGFSCTTTGTGFDGGALTSTGLGSTFLTSSLGLAGTGFLAPNPAIRLSNAPTLLPIYHCSYQVGPLRQVS